MRQTLEMEQRPGMPEQGRVARRLALGGLLAGLVPFALLVPMFIYQMEFMLYTWAWPTLAGLLGLGLGTLALRRAGAEDGRGRALAGAALLVSGLATVVALAGWVAMMAMMLTPAAPMPMP